jgi:hypothetical protein
MNHVDIRPKKINLKSVRVQQRIRRQLKRLAHTSRNSPDTVSLGPTSVDTKVTRQSLLLPETQKTYLLYTEPHPAVAITPHVQWSLSILQLKTVFTLLKVTHYRSKSLPVSQTQYAVSPKGQPTLE